MSQIMRFLGFLASIYMMIIFIRIILTWFSWERSGGLAGILAKITDPYLAWFRRFSFLRAGFIDFSPVVALGVLSLVNRVFYILASYGTISMGIILAMILQLAWGLVSFVIIFLIVILILRFIAHAAIRSNEGTFWRIIDGISRPVLYRVNRIFFKNRIVNFGTGIIVSVIALIAIYIILRALVVIASGALVKLPF